MWISGRVGTGLRFVRTPQPSFPGWRLRPDRGEGLEHFENPWRAMEEIRRTLADGGTLVIWVPFMWGFHGDDFYRFTPRF
jgi:SAM-dependent methyltransferase